MADSVKETTKQHSDNFQEFPLETNNIHHCTTLLFENISDLPMFSWYVETQLDKLQMD